MATLDVIVPIYNVQAYLGKCLDSLVAQSYRDFRVVLVNDGSKDDSASIADAYVRKHPELFVLYHKENGGLSDARNYGIEHSDAEYIAFIDSDDYISPSMFESMMNAFDEHCDVVCCDMLYIYDDGREVVSSGGDVDLAEAGFERMMINNSACNKIYHRSLFKDIRFPKGKWYEDLATIPLILFKAQGIRFVKQVFYYYYQREGSIAHQSDNRMFDIYWAIQKLETDLEASENAEWQEVKRKLLIQHGLFLTSLRIKKIDDLSERSRYYRKNIEYLSAMLKNWYSVSSLYDYPFKTRIIFFLFSIKAFRLAALIFKG